MKKAVSFLVCLSLLFCFTACGKDNGTSSEVTPTVKTGLASVHSLSVADDRAVVKTTVAAVLVGADGRIRACRLDELETGVKQENGKVIHAADTRTKSEQLYEYGLASTSPIGREWFEQAEAFSRYVVGMTADEVTALPLKDGKVQDANLASKCELSVTDFVEVISNAARSATLLGAAEEDTLSMAISAVDDSVDATDRMHVAVYLSAVTLNTDRVVSSCLTDMAEAEAKLKDGGLTGSAGRFKTNKEKKNDLMVKTTSTDEVAWFQQAGELEKYITGKTLKQIKATPLENGYAAHDTELKKGCTFMVADLLDNVIKAVESASETGETVRTTTTAKKPSESSETSDGAVHNVVSDVVSDIGGVVSDVNSFVS